MSGILWPSLQDVTVCEELPAIYLEPSNPISFGLVVLALVGIGISVAVSVTFYYHRNHRLVRATSRELSIIIILGTLVAFCDVIIFITKPSAISCWVRILAFHYGVNLLYSPLMVKNLRIYRIFTDGKTSVKQPRFVSSSAQIVITLLIVLLQVSILMESILQNPTLPKLILFIVTELFRHSKMLLKNEKAANSVSILYIYVLMHQWTVFVCIL